MIIVKDIKQGTDEWLRARAGIPTASEFSKIITGSGKRSSQAEVYARQCALEEVTSQLKKNYMSSSMVRGHEIEPEARENYEFITDNPVTEVGVVYRNEFKRESCSPDGLIFDGDTLVKGVEIKSPELHTHVEYLLNGGLPTQYIPQVQGSMWVCGVDEWDFISYHPDARPLIITVKKEKLFHQSLESYMKDFQRMKAKLVNDIKKVMES